MKENLFMDLAVNYKKNNILVSRKKYNDLVLSHYLVDEASSKDLKKDIGDFYSITFTEEILLKKHSILYKVIKKILKNILKEYNTEKTLIIGLGNSSIASDSFGVKTTNKIIATNQYNDFLTIPKIALFNPEVTEKTGINSFNLIKLVVNDYKPNCIIMIDSLATKNINYLNKCLEINNVGIIPGGALRDNREISAKTFGIPVISIGIPLVIKQNHVLFSTPNVEEINENISDILSSCLNDILLS